MRIAYFVYFGPYRHEIWRVRAAHIRWSTETRAHELPDYAPGTLREPLPQLAGFLTARPIRDPGRSRVDVAVPARAVAAVTPTAWTRVRVEVVDDADDYAPTETGDVGGGRALTSPGEHPADACRHSAGDLEHACPAPRPVLVDAEVLTWRSGEILDAVDRIRGVTNAVDSVDSPSNRRVFDAATRIRGMAKATWSETHRPSARRLRSGDDGCAPDASRRRCSARGTPDPSRPRPRRSASATPAPAWTGTWDTRWDRPTQDSGHLAWDHALTGFLEATGLTPAQVEIGRVQPLRRRTKHRWMQRIHAGPW